MYISALNHLHVVGLLEGDDQGEVPHLLVRGEVAGVLYGPLICVFSAISGGSKGQLTGEAVFCLYCIAGSSCTVLYSGGSRKFPSLCHFFVLALLEGALFLF